MAPARVPAPDQSEAEKIRNTADGWTVAAGLFVGIGIGAGWSAVSWLLPAMMVHFGYIVPALYSVLPCGFTSSRRSSTSARSWPRNNHVQPDCTVSAA
jgi:hypothetical protein